MTFRYTTVAAILTTLFLSPLRAQEKSVRPGVNDTFRDPDPKAFTERFEIESREVFAKRKEIVEALKLKPTDIVSDIGAGTGLFTRLFASAVGPEGQVIAVDIAQKFLNHIEVTTRELGLSNVETLLCKDDSTELPPESVDVAFICDTYHHFEFPQKTMTSLLQALKPGGRVIVIDFKRIEGESTEWTMSHVRAGQEVFEAEIVAAGFHKVDEVKDLLKENYMVVFEKAPPEQLTAQTERPMGRGRGAGRSPGMGRGPGAGRGMGPDASMRADQDVFHYLLEKHGSIRRQVKNLENGVETLTESDDAEVAAKIQEHVAAMHERVKSGRGLRFWDELFVAVFRNHDKISMVVENTEHGVRVVETSADAFTVKLIQAHATVVSKFVERGFDEAHENHPVPAADGSTAPAVNPDLQFPIISGFGGVVAVENGVEPPRAGMKVVLDVTAEAKKPDEVNKGLDRAARLLNLYGVTGLAASDVKITVVLHGEATMSVLSDAAWESRFQTAHNPNLPLIRSLRKAGVEVFVCGQALSYKKIAREEVSSEISVAVAALTVVLNRQTDGFAYVPVP